MSLQATTWQTVGPYFSIGLAHLNTSEIATADSAGERVVVEGTIVDGLGNPVPDAVIEVWQANAAGEYGPQAKGTEGGFEFAGFGRIPTDEAGRFRFTTVRPGAVKGPDGGVQAPHLAVRVMMRGLLRDLVTRMYFPDGEIAADFVMQSIPEHRRATLIASPVPDTERVFVWKIELQGERETVFFDF